MSIWDASKYSHLWKYMLHIYVCVYIRIYIYIYIHTLASLIAQLVKNPPALQETPIWFLGQEDPLEKGRLPTPVFLGFPYGSAGKKSTCNAGDLGLILGLGRSPGEGKVYPFQYSGLGNSRNGVAKSQTQLRDVYFHCIYTAQVYW